MEEKMELEEENDAVIDGLISRMLYTDSYVLTMKTTEIVRTYRQQIFDVKLQSQNLAKLYEDIEIPRLSDEHDYNGGSRYYIGCTPVGCEMQNIGTYTYYRENRGSRQDERIDVPASTDNVVFRYYEQMLTRFRMELLKEKAALQKKPKREKVAAFELE